MKYIAQFGNIDVGLHLIPREKETYSKQKEGFISKEKNLTYNDL